MSHNAMKARLTSACLLIIGTVLLVTGCESYDHRAASVSPDFPPGQPTLDNDPDLAAAGIPNVP